MFSRGYGVVTQPQLLKMDQRTTGLDLGHTVGTNVKRLKLRQLSQRREAGHLVVVRIQLAQHAKSPHAFKRPQSIARDSKYA